MEPDIWRAISPIGGVVTANTTGVFSCQRRTMLCMLESYGSTYLDHLGAVEIGSENDTNPRQNLFVQFNRLLRVNSLHNPIIYTGAFGSGRGCRFE